MPGVFPLFLKAKLKEAKFPDAVHLLVKGKI